MREQHYSAIILKKQPYREGDEIITLFTKEGGKIRCLAKSVKSPKSKLAAKITGFVFGGYSLGRRQNAKNYFCRTG